MPFVNVQTIKGIMSSEKNELLRRMTDLIVEIER
jgi:4-oxalocrotonate tautomerase